VKFRFLVVLMAGLALAGPATTAGGAEVSVRVEGSAETHFEGGVTTTVHPVDGGDGSGTHACSGSFGEIPTSTLTGALDDAMRSAGLAWHGQWDSSAGDFLIDSIAGEQATPAAPWSTLLNGEPTPTGGCTTPVKDGDRVLLAYEAFLKTKTLGLSGPGEVDPGEPFSLAVHDERSGDAPVAGAAVKDEEGHSAITGTEGRASLTIGEPGRYRFKAEHSEGIRSNAVEVCVGVTGCEGGPGPGARPSRIDKIVDGQLFMRGAGPRVLRGRVAGSAGVQVALTSRNAGRCRSWSAGKRRMIRRKCGRGPVWTRTAVSGSVWSARVGPLRPGRYRLLSRAVSPRIAEPRRTGINRIDFKVSGKRLDARRLGLRAAAYLRSPATRRTVSSSPLVARWVALALGRRGDRRQAAKAVRLARKLLPKQRDDGSFGGDLNLTATGAITLRRSSPERSAKAAGWLESAQHASGGFGLSEGSGPDVDSTGLAAWALALNGREEAVSAAARYVRGTQNFDGGLPAVAGGRSNAQSTGLGLLALRLSGPPPSRVRTEDGITPLHFLATLQKRNGSILYAPGLATTPGWVTAQALIGLSPAPGR